MQQNCYEHVTAKYKHFICSLLQQKNSILGAKFSILLLTSLSSSLFLFYEDVFPELVKFIACIFGVTAICPSRDMTCRGGLIEERSLETDVRDVNCHMFCAEFSAGFLIMSYGPFFTDTFMFYQV